MKRRWLIAAVAGVLLLSVFPAYMLVRSQALTRELQRYLHENMVEHNGCPIPDPFIESSAIVYQCWEGKLPGRTLVVIFGTERGSRALVTNYLGIWLPSGPDLSEAWLAGWKQRVAARGDWWAARSGVPAPSITHLFIGPSETVPIRADRVHDPGNSQDGVILAWKLVTLPTAPKLQARLDELSRSL